jgi:hypothetical protein
MAGAGLILAAAGCSPRPDHIGEVAAGQPLPADDPECGPWGAGTMTGHDNGNPSSDPGAANLAGFTGLTEAFYHDVAIAAVDSSDWNRDQYHWVDILYNGQIGRVGVWDMGAGEDCPEGRESCAESTTKLSSPGYLLDLETRTAQRIFGVTSAENTLLEQIQYRVCGAFDPDAVAAQFGAHRP